MVRLGALRGKFGGERIFIIGNGPSLAETPLERLSGEHSLAMNKINHIYDETSWRPSFYYFSQKPLADGRRECIEENIELGATCFLKSIHQDVFGEAENVFYLRTQELKAEPVRSADPLREMPLDEVEETELSQLYDYWSDDITDVVYTFHSMYGAFQVAHFLGFEEIYLLGCDLGFGIHDPHMIFDGGLDPSEYRGSERAYSKFLEDSYEEGVLGRSLANGLVYKLLQSPLNVLQEPLAEHLKVMEDPNHFTGSYRTKPKDNRYANAEITKSHLVFRRIAADKGMDVHNATLGGDLEVYPRVDLDDVLSATS